LAGEDERQPGARAPQARWLGTAFEGREERLGPEVLVDVETREGHWHAIIPIKPTGFVGYADASSSASDGALVEEIARVHSLACERTLGAVRRIGRLRAVDRVDRVGRIGALDRSFG